MEKKPQLVAKENQVAELQAQINESAGVVLADYRGLTVAEDTQLRANLRKAEITYKVAKNTLLKRAANNLEINDLDSFLEGPTAVAFGTDAIAVAKTLVEFAEKHKALEIKAGLLDGKFIDLEVITSLAKLPSREVLLAKMLGSMQSSLYSFVRVIDQIREKKEAEAAAE